MRRRVVFCSTLATHWAIWREVDEDSSIAMLCLSTMVATAAGDPQSRHILCVVEAPPSPTADRRAATPFPPPGGTTPTIFAVFAGAACLALSTNTSFLSDRRCRFEVWFGAANACSTWRDAAGMYTDAFVLIKSFRTHVHLSQLVDYKRRYRRAESSIDHV